MKRGLSVILTFIMVIGVFTSLPMSVNAKNVENADFNYERIMAELCLYDYYTDYLCHASYNSMKQSWGKTGSIAFVESAQDTNFENQINAWYAVKSVANPGNTIDNLNYQQQYELIIYGILFDALFDDELQEVTYRNSISSFSSFTKDFTETWNGAELLDKTSLTGKESQRVKDAALTFIGEANNSWAALGDYASIITKASSIIDKMGKSVAGTINIIERISMMLQLMESGSSVITFLNTLKSNSDDIFLKQAIQEVIDSISNDWMGVVEKVVLDVGFEFNKTAIKLFVDNLWGSVCSTCPFLAGMAIGDVIGTFLCNTLFATEDMLEEYSNMKKFVEINSAAVKSVEQVEDICRSYMVDGNAEVWIFSQKFMYSLVISDSKTSIKFAEISLLEGWINKLFFHDENEVTYDVFVATVNHFTEVYKNNYNLVYSESKEFIKDKYTNHYCNIYGNYDDLEFVLLNDKATYQVINCNKNVSGEVVVPSDYKGIPVTSIGLEAFRSCSNIEEIVIPNGVTIIDRFAFSECTNLASINLPDSIISLGNSAFENCSSLESIVLPTQIKTIENYTFSGCCKLSSIIIPDSVKSIGEDAFSSCNSLTSITIPDTVTIINDAFFATGYSNDSNNWDDGVLYIGNHLIEAKTSINGSYKIKKGTKTIADGAFYGCDKLTSVIVPDTVVSIGHSAFRNCTNLKSITIPDSVTSIGNGSYHNVCHNPFYNSGYYNDSNNWDNNVLYIGNHLIEAKGSIKGNYTVRKNTITIGGNAFRDCVNLSTVNIPSSVTSIGDGAFSDCSNLKVVNNASGVKVLGERAFNYCANLSDISNFKNLKEIGDYAFTNCDSLISVTIPNGVTIIGDYAFSRCGSLASITIPNSVIKIGEEAFYWCYSLKNITIPRSVINIGSRAFAECSALSSFLVESNNQYYSSINGVLFNKDKTVLIQYPAEKTDKEYTIPTSVITIGDYAFSDCWKLNSVIITDNVASIGDRVFDCCFSLKTVILSNRLASLGEHVFSNCGQLSSVIFPDSVTSIGEYAFWNCKKFKTVYYTSTETEWCKIAISDGNDDLLNADVLFLNGKPIMPTMNKISNNTNGVKVTWGIGYGANSYIVYRRAYNAKTKKWGGWSRLAEGVTSTSYLDKTAKSGTYYRYTVKANNEAGSSGYDTAGLKTYFLSTPKLTSIANNTGKVTVKWNKVSGATGYIVYRRTYNATTKKWGGWSKLATTKSNVYNDTKAKSGTFYRYTVRAYYGDYTSCFDTTGLQTKFLATPTLKTATSNKTGVKLTWGKVSGAKGYDVYRKTYSNGKWTGWTKISTVNSGSTVTITDKTAKKGVTYRYTVRAKSDSYKSYFNTKGLQVKDKY